MDVRSTNPFYRPFHFLVQLFKVMLCGAALIAFVGYFSQTDFSRYFPITTVRVYGAEHLNEDEVTGLLQPLVSRGFFNIKIERIREQLRQIPWVADLSVRRIWPGQVELTIIEKKPIATWNDVALLGESGELFTPDKKTYPVSLPQLIGPDGEQLAMMNFFVEMSRLFVPIHAKISYLELTPYRTWKLKLDNGIQMQMGHKDVLTRVAHFVKVYPKIVGKNAINVESVDLRYPNGVAIRWKAPVKT